jgi:hypothetical protein
MKHKCAYYKPVGKCTNIDHNSNVDNIKDFSVIESGVCNVTSCGGKKLCKWYKDSLYKGVTKEGRMKYTEDEE